MAITNLNSLSVAKRTIGSNVIGMGTVSVTGPMSVSGTVTLSGAKTLKGGVSTYSGSVIVTGAAKVRLRTNGTGALAGIRTIVTGGSAVVKTSRLASSSIISLTPMLNTALKCICYERYSARSAAAGTFKIVMQAYGGTAVTGRVGWTLTN